MAGCRNRLARPSSAAAVRRGESENAALDARVTGMIARKLDRARRREIYAKLFIKRK